MNELTTIELSELVKCEAVIERGLATFYDVGNALIAIRDARLYRVTHATFEEYCRGRWNLGQSRAYQMIDAAKVVDNLQGSTMVELPTTERQARELSSLEPDQQCEVWQEAVKTAPNGHVTASHIREVRQAYTAPVIEQPRRLEPPPHHRLSSDDPRRYTIVPYPSPASVPHVAHNSGNNEWYTPGEYIEAARKVMGTIDLDPASSEVANRIVKAKKFYASQDDGLSKDWRGRVWMNPPYSGDLISRFTSKLCQHFRTGAVSEAIMLVNNATETQWFQEALALASSVCFPKGRIRYLDSTGSPANTPLQGQAFLYFGERANSFKKIFGQFGGVR